MRCPKCDFITFDHVAACPKCKASLGKAAAEVQGTTLNVEAPSFLGAFASKSQQDTSVDDLLDAPDLVLPSGKPEAGLGGGDEQLFDSDDGLSADDLVLADQSDAVSRNAGEELPELDLSFDDDVQGAGDDANLQKLSASLSDIDISDLMPAAEDEYPVSAEFDEGIPSLEPLTDDQADAGLQSDDMSGALGDGLEDIDLDSISFSDLDEVPDFAPADEFDGAPAAGGGLDDLAAPDLGASDFGAEGLQEMDDLADFGDLLSGDDALMESTDDATGTDDLLSLGGESLEGGFDLNFDDELTPSAPPAATAELSLELDNSDAPLGSGGGARGTRPDIPDLGLTLESDD